MVRGSRGVRAGSRQAHTEPRFGWLHSGSRSSTTERNIILSAMHVVIADPLSSSAVEILRNVSGWTVDARPQRAAKEIAADLAEADALIVRSATQVDQRLIAAAPRL